MVAWRRITVLLLLTAARAVVGQDDKCGGLCDGGPDNATCRTVSGLYTRPVLPVGYNLIAQIPRGACDINITELGLSRNYFALRTPSSQYILNGNWAINWSGEYEGAGTTFTYRRHDPRFGSGEQVWTRGPIAETLDVLIIYQHPNPGVKYEYKLPTPAGGAAGHWSGPPARHNLVEDSPVTRRKHRHRHRGGEFRWAITGYTECSQSCGGGMQKNIVACIRRKSLVVVQDEFCDTEPKPPVQAVRCNTHVCPSFRWEAEEWGACSVSCGPGVQTRAVACRGPQDVTVTEAACSGQERPPTTQVCHPRHCVRWVPGAWVPCSARCGPGLQTRDVFCQAEGGALVPDAECGEPRPASEQPCQLASCSSSWYFSAWSDTCAAECSQSRQVFCLHAEKRCDPVTKPASRRPCPGPCTSRWFAGPWSQCNERCGAGVRTREVVCLREAGEVSAECPAETRPATHKSCSGRHCGPEWLTSEFGACSATCGTGVQVREVACVGPELQPTADCLEPHRPATRQTCNLQECGASDAKSPPKRDARCTDKYGNCPLVVRARLCTYAYYRDLCCESCSRS